MSFKAKTIALSAAGLLAAAGGFYAFMPGDQDSGSGTGKIAVSTQTATTPDVSNPVSTTGKHFIVQGPGTTIAPTEPPKNQLARQAPKKLTKAELTPPPPTENEKLEKAAEQESNF